MTGAHAAASGPVLTATAPASSEADRSISATLDPRHNGLNLLRLVMASGVVVYHAFRLSGTPIPATPLEQFLQNIWVDGFFVLSGFLIAGSWIRHPHVGPYLRNRVLRIYPAFVVCLVVTAFVFAPLGAMLGGGHVGPGDQARYVVVNLGLLVREYDIAGTPAHVPWPQAWNGSLWTLFWEFLCYLAVMALGLVGILRRRWGIPLVFGAAWLLQLAVTLSPALADVRIPVVMHRIGSLGLGDAARFAVTFTAGMLVHRLAGRLTASWGWVTLAGVLVVAAMWTPEYRLLGALPLAYGLVAAGALMKAPWCVVRTDISYGVYIYAFPVQQLLAVAGVHHQGVAIYALAAYPATFVLAYASWVIVEKPALALKAR